MNKYFYSTDGVRTIGPVDIEELKQLHLSAKISDFTLCAKEDYDLSNHYPSWFPATALDHGITAINTPREPCATQLGILGRYLGAVVAANATDPVKFEGAGLVFVGADYFSLRPMSSELPIHYSLRSILSLREWPMTVPYAIHRPVDLTLKQGALSKLFSGKIEDKPPEYMKVDVSTRLVIEIYHNVIYSGRGGAGVGVGVAIPIG
jgi:hypothetical protein